MFKNLKSIGIFAICFLLIACAVGVYLVSANKKTVKPNFVIDTVGNDIPEVIKEGNKVFYIHCAACHYLDRKDVNLREGYRKFQDDDDLFRAFVVREDSLIKINDPFILALNREWEHNYDHNFNLTSEQITSLIEFLK